MSDYELSRSIGRLVSFKPYNGGEQYRTDNFAMLPYLLAIAIIVASLFLFIGAFFSPKLHRQDDFLWSGLGLFYALVLWVCAGRFTGGALLGQIAATLLIIVFIWQTWKLRQAIAFPEDHAEAADFSVTQWLANRFSNAAAQPQSTPATVTDTVTQAVDSATSTDENLTAGRSTEKKMADSTEGTVEPPQKTTDEPAKASKPGIFNNVLGLGQSRQPVSPSSIADAIDQSEQQETEAESGGDRDTNELETTVEETVGEVSGALTDTESTPDTDGTDPTTTDSVDVNSEPEIVTEESVTDTVSASENAGAVDESEVIEDHSVSTEQNTSEVDGESEPVQSTETATETEQKDSEM